MTKNECGHWSNFVGDIRALSVRIVSSVQPIETCIILLHNLANIEVSSESHV